MPSLPLHPALVHLPIGLGMIAPILVLAVLVAVRRGLLPRTAWWLVVGFQAAVFLGGLAAAKAGERDEDRVAKVVGKPLIHHHEERAEAFLWSAGATVAVAAAAVALPFAPALFTGLSVAGSTATAGLALYAGEAGGELVYAHGAARAFVPGDAAASVAVEEGGGRRNRHLRESGRD